MYVEWKQQKPGVRPDPYWDPVSFKELRAFRERNDGVSSTHRSPHVLILQLTAAERGDVESDVLQPIPKYPSILHRFRPSCRAWTWNSQLRRLYKVRPVTDAVNKTFKDSYNLSREVSIDEAMIAFSGRLSYKQLMPAKPV